MRNIRRTRRPLVALVALLAALAIGYTVRAAGPDDSNAPPSNAPPSNALLSAAATTGPTAPPTKPGGRDEVALSSLPPEAASTVHLIRQGGPFPYPRNDGVVFHNDEHHLPSESDGYYHEYTVPTPGSADRGARRIITGKNGAFYYTGDHYGSFEHVDVSR